MRSERRQRPLAQPQRTRYHAPRKSAAGIKAAPVTKIPRIVQIQKPALQNPRAKVRMASG